MANCPNCGSNDIQIKTDSRQNVNWGRAIAGWALFGVVGGAVGAVTGKGRSETITANVCLNCGTIWDAATLYKLLQNIESVTTVELDLSLKKDRDRMNIFINEIHPLVDKAKKSKATSKSIRELTPSDIALGRNIFRILGIIGLFLSALGFAIFLSIEYKVGRGIIAVDSEMFMLNASVLIVLFGILLIGIGYAFLPSGSSEPQVNYEELLDKKISEFKNL